MVLSALTVQLSHRFPKINVLLQLTPRIQLGLFKSFYSLLILWLKKSNHFLFQKLILLWGSIPLSVLTTLSSHCLPQLM